MTFVYYKYLSSKYILHAYVPRHRLDARTGCGYMLQHRLVKY